MGLRQRIASLRHDTQLNILWVVLLLNSYIFNPYNYIVGSYSYLLFLKKGLSMSTTS